MTDNLPDSYPSGRPCYLKYEGIEPREHPLLLPAKIIIADLASRSNFAIVQIMRIAILGFGEEGKSLLKFLKKSPQFRRDKITILDRKLDKNYLKNLKRFHVIFRSPGVPYTLPELQAARKAGVVISSATKLFFSLIDREKIIGVTGTKGKGTTATLLCQILRRSGRKVVLAGNIGKPMLDILPRLSAYSLSEVSAEGGSASGGEGSSPPAPTRVERGKRKSGPFVVLELSSFQLQDLKQSPAIAVVLDVFPDHLDEHKTLTEYYSAKATIARFQKRGDAIFYFAGNKISKAIAEKSPGRKIALRPKENNLKKNYEMAAAVAKYLGCPASTIQKTISGFRGLEHRLELVRTIKPEPYSNVLKNIRIRFYNDSAATNPEAAAAAIKTLSNPPSSLILIAGGKDKGLNYTPLARIIGSSKNVKAVILFGENKYKIKRQIAKGKGQIAICKTLNSAVKIAYRTAKKLINPDARSGSRLSDKKNKKVRRDSSTHQLITILFSPASASFDQFRNYADRGRQFKQMIEKIKE